VIITALAIGSLLFALVVGVYVGLRLRPAINNLRARLDAAAARIDEVEGWRNDERRLTRELSRVRGETQRLHDEAVAFTQKTADELTLLRTDERRLTREAETALTMATNLRAKADKTEGAIDAHAKRHAAIEASLERRDETTIARFAKLDERFAAMDAGVKTIQAGLSQLADNALRNPNANAEKALSHRRRVSDEAVADFIGALGPKFGIEFRERQLYHMAHRVTAIESLSHGRLATSIDAILTRLAAALYLTKERDREFRLLEIGTLYGIGAIALYDAVRFNVPKASVTLIDPLDGYYAEGAGDYVSAAPVSRRVLEDNWRLAAGTLEDLTIIQEKSETAAAREAIAGREFDMLVIDGDHSYDGVRRDFENYFGRVRTGGVVVIDDYDVPEWPAIKKFADEKLKERADLQWIFAGHRTLLLRKI
jgi:predicted O-methyltransferase YrrM